MPKQFFKGLNGLRFFAALLVVLTHTESMRKKNGLAHLSEFTIFNDGGLAVQFFFVLSGFLITFLLLQEHDKTNDIHIGRFYMRRILRIWPLYYLLVFLGLVVVPFVLVPLLHIPYEMPFAIGTALPMYVFFLPNLVAALYAPSMLYPLWSIGVEEQFYLFWAPVVKYFRKYLIVIFLSIIILKISLNIYLHESAPEHWLTHFVDTLQFECMAIGGLGAWYVHRQSGMIRTAFFFTYFYQFFFTALLIAILFFQKTIFESSQPQAYIYKVCFAQPWANLSISLIFLYTILNVSLNSDSILKTENKVLHFLGEISYGVYMYHILIVFGFITILKRWLVGMDAFTASCILYPLIISTLVLVSWLSYRLFELPILRYKKRFE